MDAAYPAEIGALGLDLRLGTAAVGMNPVERRVGRLEQGRFVMAYHTGDRLSAVLAVGMPPRTLRTWRAAVAAGMPLPRRPRDLSTESASRTENKMEEV